MSRIIAGRFLMREKAEEGKRLLEQKGLPPETVSTFFVNPAGQHDLYPIGGDRQESPGANDVQTGAAKGATAGGVAGAAVGIATTPVLGIIGPALGTLVGAHLGSLAGGLSEMKHHDKDETQSEKREEMPIRRSGMMLAATITDDDVREKVMQVLMSLGADDIEQADGRIELGDWVDFDPRLAPDVIDQNKNTF